MAFVPPALLPFALFLTGMGQAVPSATQPDTTDAGAAETVAIGSMAERMTVPVQIAGAGPYRFIIDTGAERTVISRELAGALGLATGREVSIVAMTGVSRVGTVTIPALRVSAMPATERIEAPALNAHDLGGEGLLGLDTLRDHKVLIDFDAATMAVTPSSKRTRGRGGSSGNEIVVHARSTMGQLIVTDAEFENHRIRVVIDTGSAMSIGNSALRRLVARQASRLRPVEMTSVTGATMTLDYAQVDKVRVGGVEFVGLPIAFADVPPFERFGLVKRPALMLGMDALKFFRRVAIDFPNREVRFQMPRPDRMARRCISFVNGRCSA